MTKAKANDPGKLALCLLTALCAGGMLTFISQAESPLAGAPATTSAPPSLDPGSSASPDFGGIVPAALQKGAEIHATSQGDTEGKPLRLHLR